MNRSCVVRLPRPIHARGCATHSNGPSAARGNRPVSGGGKAGGAHPGPDTGRPEGSGATDSDAVRAQVRRCPWARKRARRAAYSAGRPRAAVQVGPCVDRREGGRGESRGQPGGTTARGWRGGATARGSAIAMRTSAVGPSPSGPGSRPPSSRSRPQRNRLVKCNPSPGRPAFASPWRRARPAEARAGPGYLGVPNLHKKLQAGADPRPRCLVAGPAPRPCRRASAVLLPGRAGIGPLRGWGLGGWGVSAHRPAPVEARRRRKGRTTQTVGRASPAPSQDTFAPWKLPGLGLSPAPVMARPEVRGHANPPSPEGLVRASWAGPAVPPLGPGRAVTGCRVRRRGCGGLETPASGMGMACGPSRRRLAACDSEGAAGRRPRSSLRP